MATPGARGRPTGTVPPGRTMMLTFMRLDLANRRAQRWLLLFAALPLVYIVTGRLGLLLAAPPGYATALFLPAGIAVTAAFVAGATVLPGTFLGSFLLNLWIGYLIAGRLNLTQTGRCPLPRRGRGHNDQRLVCGSHGAAQIPTR